MHVIIIDDEATALQPILNQTMDTDVNKYRFLKDDKALALESIKKKEPSSVYVNIDLSSVDSMALMKELKAIDNGVKILFVTGNNASNPPKEISNNIIGIIDRPLNPDDINKGLKYLSENKAVLKVNMFGSFDCFINGRIVQFASAKSKELFALLLAMNGKSLTMSQAITYLWPDRDLDKAKALYRDAVWKLRNTLEEIDFPCVTFQRALLILNKRNIKCDYYSFLEGKKRIANETFLASYDWSLDFESEIALINQQRRKHN